MAVYTYNLDSEKTIRITTNTDDSNITVDYLNNNFLISTVQIKEPENLNTEMPAANPSNILMVAREPYLVSHVDNKIIINYKGEDITLVEL